VQPVNEPANQATIDDDATIVVRETRPMPQVAGYNVTQHIGAGGMADVWLGIDQNLKRQAAVKTMSAALITDPEFIQRFAEEAQTVAGFRHDNIVTVFSSGQSTEHHWIAMEFISGGTLSDRLPGPLELDEALRIAEAMANALAYSHDHGIIHRDFKPGNILFTDEDTPILSDFGIAKSTEITEGGGLTVPGLVIGSPRYMAPEQLLGRHVSTKVDVYALGLVLFEMLVGDVPSPNIAMIKSPKEINVLAELLPSGCSKVMDVLANCLREDPDERASATEIAAQIHALRAPKAARSKLTIGLVSAGFVALIAALVATQFNQSQYQIDVVAEPAEAVLYLDGQLIRNGTIKVEGGAHRLVAVEPGHYGKIIALDSSDDAQIEVTLEKIGLPSFEEFIEFNRLFSGDVAVEELIPDAVAYEPFQRLIQIRGHTRRDETAQLDLLISDQSALAGAGDPAAQTILFLADFDMVIEGDRFNLIQQASNSGYGLATFFQALHYQWSKTGEDGTMDLSSLQVWRSLMALSEEQGLKFANMYVQQADDLLSGD
jgi:hypothetical protein